MEKVISGNMKSGWKKEDIRNDEDRITVGGGDEAIDETEKFIQLSYPHPQLCSPHPQHCAMFPQIKLRTLH